MRNRKCELCSNLARIHCASDQANLCCECDSKVHGANFLVAKHLRTLLCHVCQSPTSWMGSGPKLGHTVSVCQTCLSPNRKAEDKEANGFGDGHRVNVDHGSRHQENNDDDDEDDGGEEDDDAVENDDDHDHDHDHDDDEEDDGEDNQVVPWLYPVSLPW